MEFLWSIWHVVWLKREIKEEHNENDVPAANDIKWERARQLIEERFLLLSNDGVFRLFLENKGGKMKGHRKDSWISSNEFLYGHYSTFIGFFIIVVWTTSLEWNHLVVKLFKLFCFLIVIFQWASKCHVGVTKCDD